jgi:epoxyqueuosine reductase
LIGNWLFGCDLCQEVCPLNLGVTPTVEPEFLAWRAGATLDLAEIMALDDPGFTARFGGSPVHRAGRGGLVRNACLVAANLGRTDLAATLDKLTRDEDPGVQDAALWALKNGAGMPR